MIQKKVIFLIFLSLFFYNLNTIYSLNLGGKFNKKGDNKQLKKVLKKDIAKKQQETAEKYEASNLKVAFIPFDYSSEVDEGASEIAINELAIAMILNNAFQPYSIKEWLDETYKNNSAKNVMAIVEKAQEVKLPVDYICHGIIFKSGTKYGIKVSLYPLNKEKFPTYYYRDFLNFYSLKKIADKIVIEMIKRSDSTKGPLFARKIFINRFNLKFTERVKNSKGEFKDYNLDTIDVNRITYNKNDNFFNELLLYNFHISKIFDIENNNMHEYVDQNPYIIIPESENEVVDRSTKKKQEVLDKDSEEAKIDYIISGDVEIIKEGKLKKPKTKFTIKVTNNNIRNYKVLFYKEYYFDNLNLDSLYQNMREYSKHIMLTLLDSEEQKKVGEVSIDSYYGSDEMFINDTYLGWGDQPNLLLPLDVSDIDTVFYKNWKKETNINILPFDVNKPERPFFKMSIGLMLLSRFLLHPVYNENAEIKFAEDDNLIFNVDDVYKDNNVQLDSFFHLSTQHGLGVDFSLESKYFGIDSSIALIIGECFRYKQIDADGPLNINNKNIENFKSRYEISKLSVITDFNVLLCGILLPTDWRIRIYGGLGFFNALWYNHLNESITGEGTIDGVFYEFENEYTNIGSLFLSLGVFPEVGIMYKFLKFNLKAGIAYYFDLYKYIFFSDTRNSNFDTFNTSSVAIKLSCGYYLN